MEIIIIACFSTFGIGIMAGIFYQKNKDIDEKYK